ncbi:Methyltransferase-like protein 10 [Chamberlinius hualienensis]
MGDSELQPSSLGTKEYWDRVYTEEYSNYEDHGDCGEIWFGESTVKRVIHWMKNSLNHKVIEIDQSSVLDVGCGNGMFLIELQKLGFKSVTGVDYSDNAVKLAIKIVSETYSNVVIEAGNILEFNESTSSSLRQTYDICTDKGTYDAISLDPEDSKSKRLAYIENILRILKPSTGLLIITSCNWTKDELLTQFNDGFTFMDEIPMPSFQFGGKSGQKVTSLVLQKKI